MWNELIKYRDSGKLSEHELKLLKIHLSTLNTASGSIRCRAEIESFIEDLKAKYEN